MQTRYGQTIRDKEWGTSHLSETQPTDEVIASSGVPFRLWRLYQHFWLFCLLFPLLSFVSEPLAPWRLLVRVFALVFFAASYTWLMWPHPVSQRTQTRSRLSFLLFVLLSLQVTVFSLVDSPAWLWLFIGISGIAGVLLSLRTAAAVVVLFTLLPLFITIRIHAGVVGIDWWWLLALMLVVRGLGVDMIGVALLSNALQELHTTRLDLARLAVIEERARLSRDLHDLLGQTLSMITLKSELARYLIVEDPERCTQELFEIEQVARKSLREVREVVAGYKQLQLLCELEGARHLLEAAGIDSQITPVYEVFPPETDAVLAWIVREGVTNVIRHSRAQWCRITLTRENGTLRIEVLNNGGGVERAESVSGRSGVGLAGLRERVTSLGGHMEAGPVMFSRQESFRLWAVLPIQGRVQAERVRKEIP